MLSCCLLFEIQARPMDPISEKKLEYHKKRADYHQRKMNAVLEDYSRAAQQVKSKAMPKKPWPAIQDELDKTSADEKSGAWYASTCTILNLFFLFEVGELWAQRLVQARRRSLGGGGLAKREDGRKRRETNGERTGKGRRRREENRASKDRRWGQG